MGHPYVLPKGMAVNRRKKQIGPKRFQSAISLAIHPMIGRD